MIARSRNDRTRRVALAGVTLTLFGCAVLAPGDDAQAPRFFKGNTHTHTLWSDGDAAPEHVVDWYRSNGYHFLVLSDHNVMATTETWFPIAEDSRLTAARVADLAERFGDQSGVTRPVGDDAGDGGLEMRLWTLAQLEQRFERRGEFVLVPGEEVTASFESAPIHVNALNVTNVVDPITGTSLVDTINRNIDAIRAEGERSGRPVLAHLNHPNYGWAVTPEQLAQIRGERFFEVYNGHPGVRNHGDDEHVSMEEAWDIALTLRLSELGLGVLYGLATDDAHNHYGPTGSTPGRGWVQVRATSLEEDALIAAMQRGDFYASSGVELLDFSFDGTRFEIDIDAEPGVTYTTTFRGTRRGAEDEPGAVLASTTGLTALYALRGDELYVRATIVSSKPHPNPFAEGDVETAWVQPVAPQSSER